MTFSLPVSIDAETLVERLADAVDRAVAARTRAAVPKFALSVAEAAEAIAISRAAAYRMVDKGELPAIVIGGRKVVPVAALEEWIATHS